MAVYKLEESEEDETVLYPEETGGEDPGVLNSEKESSEHFRRTHLEQVQHCTYLPRQVTFPAQNEQGKTGPGLNERCRSSEERGDEDEQEKGNRRSIFKEAACCPSAVVQRAARRKNGLCEVSVRGN